MSIYKSAYREFSSIEEASEWGNEHYKQWADEYKKNIFILNDVYNIQEAAALDCYCGFAYQNMNSILRNIPVPNLSDNIITYYKTMNKLLEFSILCAPRVPENIIVYRGISNIFMESLKKAVTDTAGYVVERGFLSTSLISNFVIKNNYDALLRIYVPKGEFGMYVTNLTGRPQEQEMLFMPNSYIRLIDDSSIHLHSTTEINGHKFYDCELIHLIFDL